MLTKPKSASTKLMLYVLILPLTCLLLFAFAKRSTSVRPAPVRSVVKGFQGTVPSISPVDVTKLKSVNKFGMRFHPVFQVMREHTGIDFTLDEGEAVMATGSGVVIEAGSDQIMGNYVIIRHTAKLVTKYYHCKSLSVHTSDNVKQGQQIGTVGNTGLSSEHHLHYEVILEGKPVNPKAYLPEIPGC